jgi:cathepsin L
MKAVLFLALLVGVAVAARSERQYQREFTQWMQQNKRSYHHDEFQKKYGTFKANLDFIDAHNADTTKTHKVALNQFADLSVEEFSRIYLGTRKTFESVPTVQSARPDAPASKDWRQEGVVTPIKNQQQCGSCWSFSTTGSTEGCHALKHGRNALVGLSEQNLMDCSTSYGNQGCNGGLMTQAMQYIIANGGIDTEASYPYTAEDGTSCQYTAANRGAGLKSFTNVKQGDENDLLNKANSGPVSVAIDASHSSFQFYSSGVYNEPACSTSQLDHGVLVAGWGVSGSTDYWLVKNSWGTSWGQAGYIWMSRNANNQCGIATMATLPSC